ncbi:hypothetical protein NQ314_017255, partial [Rhamnusium bicolor]
ASWGYPFDLYDLRLLVKSYLDKKIVQENRLTNNLPGRDWSTNFVKRHKNVISNRLSANISSKRAMMTSEKLDAFFENAREKLKSTNPSLIINYDETNLTDNPGAKKFILKGGTKYPERLLPEYVVYKAENMWNTWTIGRPPGTRYNRSRSDWFDNVCFEDWFFTVVIPFLSDKEGQKLSTLSKDVFPLLLKILHNKLMEDGKGPQNLISGFRKTGLRPFDPMQPKRRLPSEHIATDETPTFVFNSVVEMLTAMRTGSDTSLSKQRRKRVTVEPGKSITANDVVASTNYYAKMYT